MIQKHGLSHDNYYYSTILTIILTINCSTILTTFLIINRGKMK